MEQELTGILGGWEGYTLGTAGRLEVGPERARPEVWMELFPVRGRPRRCSGCKEMVEDIHDLTERWVRDLPILDADTWLLVHRVRVACPRCGPKLEELDWLGRYARMTRRMAEKVALLCEIATIKHVADWFGLDWSTVKETHKAYLKEKLGPPDLSDLGMIVLDEFSLRKGHRYATLVLSPEEKRVVWVGRGRKREDIRPFFQLLGEEGRKRLRAVGMDMSLPYEEEVRAQCPHADIVYDLFHVVAKYGHDVIDRVRVDEANRLRYDKKARKLIKGARWLLLRSSNSHSPDQRVRLRELLAANRALMISYVLRDDLRHLWDYRSLLPAIRFWRQWRHRAMRSRVKPLVAFARKLTKRIGGILNHSRWPIHTSLLEGIINKIKVIKRMAYGFRDHEYFFLRIRAAYPGISR